MSYCRNIWQGGRSYVMGLRVGYVGVTSSADDSGIPESYS